MDSNTKNIDVFCRQNQMAFRNYLSRFAADRILLSPVAFCVVLPLLLFCMLNGMKYGLVVGLGYVPALVGMVAFKILFELGVRVKPKAMIWIDAVVLCIFLGFNFILWHIAVDNKLAQISSNGSLAIILVTINFLSMNRSQIRMLSKTLICIALQTAFLWMLDPSLIALFKMELIFGLAFSLATGYLKNQVFKLYFYHTETGSASLMHAYSQLQKLVFPHQLDLMKVGFSLEDSMPVGSGDAAVLCYDVQNSSQMPQATLNEFIQKIMERCHDIFSSGYSRNPLQVTAFKLKEVGDGFICTIGFPFAQPEPLSAYETAVQVALACQRVTEEVRREMKLSSGYCSIGIASGTLHSFYTRVGIKVYDVYGSPLVMARRYEEFRKQYQQHQRVAEGDLIAIEAHTLEMCPRPLREKFTRLDLDRIGLKIRDDANARHVYVAIFSSADEHITRLAS